MVRYGGGIPTPVIKMGQNGSLFSLVVSKNVKTYFSQLEHIDKHCFAKSDHVATIELIDCNRPAYTYVLAISMTKPGAVIGYLCLSNIRLEKCARILKFAVLPEYRGQGAGRGLLGRAIEIAQAARIQCLRLHVATFRVPAIHLYKEAGFEIKETLKDYYAPNKDAYCMEKYLIDL